MRRIVLLMTLVGALLTGFLYLELREDQVDGGGIIGPSSGGSAVESSALGALAAPAALAARARTVVFARAGLERRELPLEELPLELSRRLRRRLLLLVDLRSLLLRRHRHLRK